VLSLLFTRARTRAHTATSPTTSTTTSLAAATAARTLLLKQQQLHQQQRPRLVALGGSRALAAVGARAASSSLDPPAKPTTTKTTMPSANARWYRLGDSAMLVLSVGDITQWSGDAIVNAANERMLGGGGVDGAIHRAAGPKLREACLQVPEVAPGVRCPTGEARITRGGRLQAKYVIHTVGPVYGRESGTDDDEAGGAAGGAGGGNGAGSAPALLYSAYRASLALAAKHRLENVAFPAISTGVYGYPMGEAAVVALTAVKEAIAGGGGGAAAGAGPSSGGGSAALGGSSGGAALGSGGSPVRYVEFVLFDQKALDTFSKAADELLDLIPGAGGPTVDEPPPQAPAGAGGAANGEGGAGESLHPSSQAAQPTGDRDGTGSVGPGAGGGDAMEDDAIGGAAQQQGTAGAAGAPSDDATAAAAARAAQAAPAPPSFVTPSGVAGGGGGGGPAPSSAAAPSATWSGGPVPSRR
jgi:O-acetyl-ADP-ribose deacetylase (regulator of RNase III)